MDSVLGVIIKLCCTGMCHLNYVIQKTSNRKRQVLIEKEINYQREYKIAPLGRQDKPHPKSTWIEVINIHSTSS